MLSFYLTNVLQIRWSIVGVYISNINADHSKDGLKFPEDEVKWDGWALKIQVLPWDALFVYR